MCCGPLELTFAIIKPHIIKNPCALRAIQNRVLNHNFKIVQSKRHNFSEKDASVFYEEHRHKFFYNRLVTFMISGPSDLYILARFNAIKKWREMMGPTKVFRAIYEAPCSIRGEFGLSDTRNATHGSDSRESVKREIGIFFPEFSIENWYQNEEVYFRKDQLEFIGEKFVHIVRVKDKQVN